MFSSMYLFLSGAPLGGQRNTEQRGSPCRCSASLRWIQSLFFLFLWNISFYRKTYPAYFSWETRRQKNNKYSQRIQLYIFTTLLLSMPLFTEAQQTPVKKLKGKRTKKQNKMRLHKNSVVHLQNSFPSDREKQKWEGRSGGMGRLSPFSSASLCLILTALLATHTHTCCTAPTSFPLSSALSNRHTSLVHYYSPSLPKTRNAKRGRERGGKKQACCI